MRHWVYTAVPAAVRPTKVSFLGIEGCRMDEPDKIPSIGISYQIQTRPSRTLVLQAFVERDCAPADLNALLDKLRDAAERQQAWEKLDDIRLELRRANLQATQQQVAIA